MTNQPVFTKYICWTAVFVGALVGLGLSFLLNLFSIAIGLSAFTINKEGLIVLASGGFLGILLGVIVAMFTAGYAAGYLGRGRDVRDQLGVIHGFTAWCLSLIFMVILAMQIGQYVAGYTRFITHPAAVVINANPTSETIDITVEKGKQMTSSATSEQVEETTNKIRLGAFIIFILFFVGALSSCFGGYFGMVFRKKHDSRF